MAGKTEFGVSPDVAVALVPRQPAGNHDDAALSALQGLRMKMEEELRDR
jgi:hypothetical protein